MLRRLLFHIKVKKISQQKSVNQTSTEIINIWKKVTTEVTTGYGCFQSINTMKKRLTKLLIHYCSVVKAGESSTGRARNERRETFLEIRDTLFDISKHDIEENLCIEDYDFIVDQQIVDQ